MLMMKSIAQEVAPYRIRVNSIAPGAIRTPINTEAWETPEAYSDLMKLVPYKRIGETDDIGRAAVWLSCKQLSNGVPASAIRYYEQVGVMPRPHHVSGRRTYDATALISLSANRAWGRRAVRGRGRRSRMSETRGLRWRRS